MTYLGIKLYRLWLHSWSMLVKLHSWHFQDCGLGCILSKHSRHVSSVSNLTTLWIRLLMSAKEKMARMTEKTYWPCCWKRKIQNPSTQCLIWKSMMKYWHFCLEDLRPPHHSSVGCYTTWVSVEWNYLVADAEAIAYFSSLLHLDMHGNPMIVTSCCNVGSNVGVVTFTHYWRNSSFSYFENEMFN